MKKGWIFVAAIAAWALALCFLVGCGKNADDATDQNGTEKQSEEQTDAGTEANSGETADAVVTIGDKTFLLKNDADLNGLHYKENYVDFNTDRVGNLKTMSYNFDGAFSFEVRVYCEEEHSFEEVKAQMSDYEESVKEVNGIAYTYYAYKNDLGDDAHYYMVEYENKTYSIIFFLGENPGNIEEVFMDNVRFE